jgi:hypothetical protein
MNKDKKMIPVTVKSSGKYRKSSARRENAETVLQPDTSLENLGETGHETGSREQASHYLHREGPRETEP